MILALHGETLTTSNLLTHIRVTRETGYDAVELGHGQLMRYLGQGFGTESLLPILKDIPPIAMGYVKDIERQEPAQYAALLERGALPVAYAERLSAARRMEEQLILELRTAEGACLAELGGRFGRDALREYRTTIAQLAGAGLVRNEGSRVALTGDGMALANEVAVRVIS